jgi:hypothetical protein
VHYSIPDARSSILGGDRTPLASVASGVVAFGDRARYKAPMIGAGELLVLAAVVGVLYLALTPLRRWLEARIARLMAGRRRGRSSARVVVLERRRDGTFGPEGRDGG